MHPVGPGKWQEKVTNMKNEKCTCRNVGPGLWQKKLKNVENQTNTLYDLQYCQKTEKRGK